jgi:uncharacterized repeat protein (TIGR03803 family)
MKKFYTAIYMVAAFAQSVVPAPPTLATIYTLSGAYPLGLTAADGALYGAAYAPANTGECGFVFELQPPSTPGGAWTETVLYTFGITTGPDACQPVAAPLGGPDGELYGITSTGGTYGNGAVYELQPPAVPGGSWSETVIYSFTLTLGPTQGWPTSLVLGPKGQIYVTSLGSTNGAGSMIELQPPASPGGAWTALPLYTFTGGTAGWAPTSLTAGPKGRFYGGTEYGGTAHGLGAGTIFDLLPPAAPGGPWTEKVLLSFNGKNGAVPNAVTLGSDGSLYGSTHPYGKYGGPVYQLTPPSSPGGAWSQTILADFGTTYSCGPDSPVIVRHGNVYGSTCLAGGGEVFELQPPSAPGGSWTNTPLYTFTNGQIPIGSMVLTPNGTVYGVTNNPGSEGPGGTVYQITTQ